MRGPAQIASWMTDEELAAWVRDAPDAEALRKRLAIWMTHTGPFAAHRVADLLQVSKQAVWLWVGQYNHEGPESLDRKGRGGRRWGFLSLDAEASFLRRLDERAGNGEILTAKQILPEIIRETGRDVSLAYVYGLLRRHQWRKLTPRPHHVKANLEAQEAFKKNCPESLRTPQQKSQPESD